TAAQAVSCMRFGAYDCLTGPMNGRTIGASLDRMIQPSIPDKQLFSGESSIIMIMQKRLIQYSSLPYPVLITGETGSGKDLAAKTIHLQGNRREKSFTAVNCASYPEDLLTTELFGSLKGAFTGSTDRPGLFESSSGGTLFLDEIGELSLRNQGSLLRVIEDGYVRRMGSHKTKKIDVRIIAATNKNLRKCIRHGSFRSDLFYRLNLLGITIPPLRKRKEDIPGLTREYLKTIQTKTPWQVENRAMSVLIRHNWPGNVRELQSVLLRASLSSENNKIRASDLFISDPNEDLPLFSEVL
ncbi:MAG: sigma-54-dependent Fis family transcriptional regulator, partial [Spirochaetaceae bacterium]|nr:sigma-54-dependent Fis family transcriptional regulator [Spirochaetaceae bacterium]